MKIKGRLIILIIQFGILLGATWWATGSFFSPENWFLSGLFAVVINPQLLEPYYPRPADVVGNCLIALVLCLVPGRFEVITGKIVFTDLLGGIIVLTLFSMIFGLQKQNLKLANFARAFRIITSEATALRIYSIVFWLSLFETYSISDKRFWILGTAWLIIIFITSIDWKKIWVTITEFSGNAVVEGIVSPTVLLVSSPDLPMAGKLVKIGAGSFTTQGVVTSRIRRVDDVWGQISIGSENDCEKLMNFTSVLVSETECSDELIGSIEEGSTESNLTFYPTKNLVVGDVVTVIEDNREILYQITSARIHQTDIKNGSYYHTIAVANQIGIFNSDSYCVEHHRWVPKIGSKLVRKKNSLDIDPNNIPQTWFKLGNILGTEIPIFIDTDVAAEGHLAILGMTKMGKTTFSARYSEFLSKSKCVTILDQTGEYIKKKNLQVYDADHLKSPTGLKVYEPRLTDNLPEFAKNFLRNVVNQGRLEYEQGQPISRIILIDEAHQFIPEPALLNFGNDARDASIYTGNLMMQVRKYGISIILVSQRTAVVAKSALSQCENIIAFKSTDHTGLDYLESVVGNQVREILPKLRQGEALVYGPAFSTDNPIVVKVSEN